METKLIEISIEDYQHIIGKLTEVFNTQFNLLTTISLLISKINDNRIDELEIEND